MHGVVKSWNDSKGYGFIKTEDGIEVFCHWSNVKVPGFKKLAIGQKVVFDMYEGPSEGKFFARNVQEE